MQIDLVSETETLFENNTSHETSISLLIKYILILGLKRDVSAMGLHVNNINSLLQVRDSLLILLTHCLIHEP